MSLHNLKNYKEAKAILPHIDAIIKVLNLTEKGLSHFNSFIPVARILKVIREEKSILESYKQEFEIVRKSKGKKIE